MIALGKICVDLTGPWNICISERPKIMTKVGTMNKTKYGVFLVNTHTLWL